MSIMICSDVVIDKIVYGFDKYVKTIQDKNLFGKAVLELNVFAFNAKYKESVKVIDYTYKEPFFSKEDRVVIDSCVDTWIYQLDDVSEKNFILSQVKKLKDVLGVKGNCLDLDFVEETKESFEASNKTLTEKVINIQARILKETKIDKKLNPAKKIRRDVFLKELLDDKFLVRCRYKYTDDYCYDASVNNHTQDSFTNALGTFEYTKEKTDKSLDDLKWYIQASSVYWSHDKSDIINVSFASCQSWELKYKEFN